jgi:hypothetical protein
VINFIQISATIHVGIQSISSVTIPSDVLRALDVADFTLSGTPEEGDVVTATLRTGTFAAKTAEYTVANGDDLEAVANGLAAAIAAAGTYTADAVDDSGDFDVSVRGTPSLALDVAVSVALVGSGDLAVSAVALTDNVTAPTNRTAISVVEGAGTTSHSVTDDGLYGYYQNVVNFMRTSYAWSRYTPQQIARHNVPLTIF